MFKSSIETIKQFKNILNALPVDVYSKPCPTLSGSSIGQHTRHVIELYQCLINGYLNAIVSYDKRERNKQLEVDLNFSILKLGEIQTSLEKKNKDLMICYEINGTNHNVSSNYFREVMYNLEHAIHHEALIKIAIQEFSTINLPESFGIAPSTLQYKKSCAQ